MTILLSIVGVLVRFAAAILTTTLGWASTLMFGRVQRSHQITSSRCWPDIGAAAGVHRRRSRAGARRCRSQL